MRGARRTLPLYFCVNSHYFPANAHLLREMGSISFEPRELGPQASGTSSALVLLLMPCYNQNKEGTLCLR